MSPDGKSVSATATFNFGDWEINKGHVDIAYDPLKLELTSACNDSQGGANFVKCSQPGSGVIRFDLADSGVTGAVDIGAAKFAPVQDATGTATLTISAADLYNGVPYTPEIVAGPNTTGSGKRTFTIADNGTVTNAPATTTGSSVRSNAVRATSIRTGPAFTVVTASVRTRSTSPNANLWVRTSATDIQPGDIVPVTVGVTTGTRSIDGAQVVLRTGPGVQLVDRDGTPVTSANSLDVGTGAALPSLLHRAFNAGQGLLELAFGRQVNPSISGVSGEATLGTLYLKVTGPTQGDLITIERQGSGQFASLVAGDGDDLTGSLIGLSTTDTVNAPV
ncbi:MAG: hypothetical protein EBU21_16750, partial [Proteobacteria bacterium]|nr:hypothetical protein [Pseudomonadota bacterium]